MMRMSWTGIGVVGLLAAGAMMSIAGVTSTQGQEPAAFDFTAYKAAYASPLSVG